MATFYLCCPKGLKIEGLTSLAIVDDDSNFKGKHKYS